MFANNAKIRPDVIRAAFNEMGESSLNVLIYVYIEAADYNEELDVRHELMLEIMRIAQRVGVEFAFPTRTLHLMDHTMVTDSASAENLEISRK